MSVNMYLTNANQMKPLACPQTAFATGIIVEGHLFLRFQIQHWLFDVQLTRTHQLYRQSRREAS